jgi:hypothetical protein
MGQKRCNKEKNRIDRNADKNKKKREIKEPKKPIKILNNKGEVIRIIPA